MKKVFLVFTILTMALITAATASAQEVWGKGGGISYSMAGVEGGFRWNSADVDTANSNKQEIGFQIGGSAVFDLTENFGIKTGLFYTDRPFKATFATTPEITGTGKISYFDVPVFAMFKFEDYAGVYAGPSLGIKLGDEYSTAPGGGGSLTDIKGMIIPFTFGAQFKMSESLGLNLFFESAGELAKGVKTSRAVGVNALFTF